MANYQRYQTLSSAEQYLFSASCPVWVSRYQISWDVQTGARLLQTRMVTVSEKAITAVYLRVHCRDAQDQALTTLHLVPVTNLFVSPGEVFGDDKVVSLWPKRTAFAEVFAERVCFSDGTAWNETQPADYYAFPSPAPVYPQDTAYPRLALAAREGGARNDFYFRKTPQVWLCTCGVPNANTVLRCRHCGADRLWLETHMDADSLFAPPAPAPAPEPEPEPEEKVAAPLEKFDLASYLNAEPLTTPVAPETEFPDMSKAAPAPTPSPAPPPEQKKSHAGRIVAILLAVLLFLGAGGWFGYVYFLDPYLRYGKAAELESKANATVTEAAVAMDEGDREKAALGFQSAIEDYGQAMEKYDALGEYSDSRERVERCRAQIGVCMMQLGDYAGAYELLSQFDGYESYLADCLYAQGVLAYNNGDLATAWSFVERLAAEHPAYEKTQALRDSCCYGFGSNELADADELTGENRLAEAKQAYETARQWFQSAGEYSNSAEMVLYCDYYLADLAAKMTGDAQDPEALLEAIDAFAALNGYSDSAQRRLDCMFDYACMLCDPDDDDVRSFLEELIDAGYSGAQELYDQLYMLRVDIALLDGDDRSFPETATLEELEDLWVSYCISGGRSDDTVRILMVYTLPGTAGGQLTLNEDGSREDEVLLYDLIPVRATKAGEAKLQFYDADSGEELYYEIVQIPEEETSDS